MGFGLPTLKNFQKLLASLRQDFVVGVVVACFFHRNQLKHKYYNFRIESHSISRGCWFLHFDTMHTKD